MKVLVVISSAVRRSSIFHIKLFGKRNLKLNSNQYSYENPRVVTPVSCYTFIFSLETKPIYTNTYDFYP